MLTANEQVQERGTVELNINNMNAVKVTVLVVDSKLWGSSWIWIDST